LSLNEAERIRVLFVEHRAGIGGGQTHLLEVLRHLDRGRFEPFASLVSEGYCHDQLAALDIETSVIDIRRVLRKSPLKTLHNVSALARLIKRKRIQLVHCGSLKSLLVAGPAARHRRIPAIWHAHVTGDFGWPLDIAGCWLSSLIIAGSHCIARRFERCPYADRKLNVIHDGVDTHHFDPNRGYPDLRAELGLAADQTVIGYVGRLEREKGIDVFTEAIPGIAGRDERIGFLIVGGDPDGGSTLEGPLRQRLEASGHIGRVRFAGFRADTAPCFAAMDMLVAPSRSEGFGLAIAEAMAMGLPVVASRVGGIPEVVEDGRTGILVPPSDSRMAAAAVIDLLSDRSRMAGMGRAGRQRILTQFSMERHVAGLEKVYEGLARPRGRGGSVEDPGFRGSGT
jgi:glycosyltransferase involved in cell wall biosynthesis